MPRAHFAACSLVVGLWPCLATTTLLALASTAHLPARCACTAALYCASTLARSCCALVHCAFLSLRTVSVLLCNKLTIVHSRSYTRARA